MSELMTVNDNQVAVQPQSASNEMAMMIMNMASNPDVDTDKLEKLMDLYERDADRQAKIAFNKDFTSMQSEITTVSKSKVAHKWKYATLEDIVDIVRPTLQEFGFAISFDIDTAEKVIVTCNLMHREGHSISTTITLMPDKVSQNVVQSIGSSVSYGKRYTIMSLLNIATRDDDDAQSSASNQGRTVTAFQAETLEKRFEKLSKVDKDFVKSSMAKKYSVSELWDLPANSFNSLLAYINSRIASPTKEVETA